MTEFVTTQAAVPTRDELLARAEALRPLLRERQAETERESRFAPDIQEAFERAGFYKILQPRRFGGYELDLRTFYDVMIEISRGCPSSGWLLCLGAGHALQIGTYFDERAQEEIFGDGHFVAPMSFFGEGHHVEIVDGGYRVRGIWRYASGIPYATHFTGVAPSPDPDRIGALALIIVVPRGQYRMLDDWGDLIGFRGSGSNSVVLDDVFVPHHLAAPFDLFQDFPEGPPGYQLHRNPLYAGPFMAFGTGELASVNVGLGYAALDEYEHLITTKPRGGLTNPGLLRMYDANFQRAFGMATGCVDAARAVLLSTGDDYVEFARQQVEEGVPFSPERAMRIYGRQVTATRLTFDAGDLLYRTSGSTPSKDGQRMQRYWRDFSAFRSNAVHQFEFRAPAIAQARLGLPVEFL